MYIHFFLILPACSGLTFFHFNFARVLIYIWDMLLSGRGPRLEGGMCACGWYLDGGVVDLVVGHVVILRFACHGQFCFSSPLHDIDVSP